MTIDWDFAILLLGGLLFYAGALTGGFTIQTVIGPGGPQVVHPPIPPLQGGLMWSGIIIFLVAFFHIVLFYKDEKHGVQVLDEAEGR